MINILSIEFDCISRRSNGLIFVKFNDEWSLLDENGDILPSKYSEITDYNDEFVLYTKVSWNIKEEGKINKQRKHIDIITYKKYFANASLYACSKYISGSGFELYGYVNKNWDVIIPFEYIAVSRISKHGYAFVKNIDDKQGLICIKDNSASFIIPPAYDDIKIYKGGRFAKVTKSQWHSEEGDLIWDLYEKVIIIPFRQTQKICKAIGYDVFIVQYKDKSSVYDTDGIEIIPPNYDEFIQVDDMLCGRIIGSKYPDIFRMSGELISTPSQYIFDKYQEILDNRYYNNVGDDWPGDNQSNIGCGAGWSCDNCPNAGCPAHPMN